ncbi:MULTISPECIES: ABC-type transport auxiliary lipoprotein family protein [unclassified Yoonia]|uniref:ABC-type transport auxiliary lipoprotein family protein n=1 Tax=unclassified Yoonia TaxID=2629118 RepID=UPI002AFFD700|nr:MULTISPECIES: ABC-type transport auxiliary lipoprotein family protein [unclassified Yoonia]
MTPTRLTRRLAIFGGAVALSGCSAVSALNSAGTARDTYDLIPPSGSVTGRQTQRTLLVALPDATAAINTDRILVRPNAAAITYLPDGRWTAELPRVVQSLLVRSISATGRIGYVGPAEGGPVPDSALLTRVDAFDVTIGADGIPVAAIDMTLTVLNDRDQRVLATRRFSQSVPVANDSSAAIVAGFQALVDSLLPAMADWVLASA